ncbi:hypothetical protein ACGFY9_19915 [Streptomyces sp. NPDC048504]|uniref:hypothetical protein n=1 Tax=Streptomyces sp. NPDC048504 TaxID=3365559 RepID=UPI0037179BA0
MQWRVGNGHWHKASLHWNKKTNQRLTGAVELPKKSIKAVDYDFLDVRSGACGGTRLDWYTGNGFEYWPWNGTPGKPA